MNTGCELQDLLKSLKSAFGKYASKTALKCGNLALSYQDVDAITDHIAKTLAARPNSSPIVYLGNPQILPHLYGIACIKANTAFLMLNRNLSCTNILGIISQLQAEPVILTDEGFDTSPFPGLDFEVVSDFWGEERFAPGELALPDRNLETVVSYQTTSGSTGTPKIVPCTYADLLQHVRLTGLAIDMNCGDVIGNTGDYILEHLLVALLNGATMSFCNVPATPAHAICSWIRDDHVSTLCCYVNAFRIFEHVTGRFQSLKTVVCYGDMPLASDVQIFESICTPGAKLINGYGLQETGYITRYLHEFGDDVADSGIPIGHPVVENAIALIDEAGNVVPRGQLGEIVIREPLLSVQKCGYVGGAEGSGGLRYKDKQLIGFGTGDLAWFDDSDCLHLAGRKDDQVKISGYNVNLRDVERAVLALPEVSQAAVSVHELGLGSRILCCHYVGDAEVEAVRRDLNEKLPSFMQPHHFRKTSHLPRNANGKIVRRELHFEPAPEIAPKRGALAQAEAKISSIWTGLLGHSNFDVDSQFLDVGGHSLASIKLSLAIEREFGQHISFREFTESGMSISGLLGILKDRGALERPGGQNKPRQAQQGITSAPRPIVAGDLLALNKKILQQWPGRPLPDFELFKCENDRPDALPVVWIFQTSAEYVNLSKALGPEYALYGGRSFAGLASEFENESEEELTLYKEKIVLDTARAYLAEILELTGGRPFVLGGNCQAALIALCMADRLAQMNYPIKGLVILNHIEDRQDYALPTTLLFGASEFEELAEQPKGIQAFSNCTVKVIDGTHGKFFDAERVDAIAKAITAFH